MKKSVWVFVVAVIAFGLLAPAWGQNNEGTAAQTPAPTAPERANAPLGPKVLVYEDWLTDWQDALNALGVNYTRYTDAQLGDFLTQLNTGTWDLVCITQSNMTALDSHWAEVEAYLDAGGKLIIFNYTMDSVPDATLWAKMGAQWEAEILTAENIQRMDTAHSVWARSNACPDLIAFDAALDKGDYVSVDSSLVRARAVGRQTSGTAAQARLICREDHRTILNSFLPENYEAIDTDTDGIPDIRELMMNEVIYVLNNGWSILLLDDFTATLNPRFTNALDRLGLIYTVDTDTTAFLNHLTSGNWALVCVYTAYTGMNPNWGQLNSYLSAGGRLIVMYWNMNGVPGESLWATMGASWQSDISAAEAVHRWVSGNALFQRPEICPDLTSFVDYATDNGDYIQALAGATALAGLQGIPPDPTKARVVMRNDGRSILDTFVAVDYGGGGGAPPDVDGDGVTDVTEWMTNQVAMAGGHEKFTYHVLRGRQGQLWVFRRHQRHRHAAYLHWHYPPGRRRSDH